MPGSYSPFHPGAPTPDDGDCRPQYSNNDCGRPPDRAKKVISTGGTCGVSSRCFQYYLIPGPVGKVLLDRIIIPGTIVLSTLVPYGPDGPAYALLSIYGRGETHNNAPVQVQTT